MLTGLPDGARSATRIAVATLGVLTSLGAVEHGVGEIRQGRGKPESLVIQSWPDTPLLAPLSGEPALTVVPDLMLTGILTVVVALVVAGWTVGFVHRPRGGLVLIGLSVLLLLVGGGFGPPLMGVLLGFAATRAASTPRRPPGRLRHRLGRGWRVLLAATVVAYLALLPGVVLLNGLAGVDSPELILVLTVLMFAGLILTLTATRAHDQAEADSA